MGREKLYSSSSQRARSAILQRSEQKGRCFALLSFGIGLRQVGHLRGSTKKT